VVWKEVEKKFGSGDLLGSENPKTLPPALTRTVKTASLGFWAAVTR
jgi:hypothetical protein